MRSGIGVLFADGVVDERDIKVPAGPYRYGDEFDEGESGCLRDFVDPRPGLPAAAVVRPPAAFGVDVAAGGGVAPPDVAAVGVVGPGTDDDVAVAGFGVEGQGVLPVGVAGGSVGGTQRCGGWFHAVAKKFRRAARPAGTPGCAG